jgi:hypothetical protein
MYISKILSTHNTFLHFKIFKINWPFAVSPVLDMCLAMFILVLLLKIVDVLAYCAHVFVRVAPLILLVGCLVVGICFWKF